MWGVGGGAGGRACLSENTLNMKVFIARYVYPKHRATQEYSNDILGTIISLISNYFSQTEDSDAIHLLGEAGRSAT